MKEDFHRERKGSFVSNISKRRKIWEMILLTGFLLVCSLSLLLANPGPTLSAMLQVASAVAGARLGSTFQKDKTSEIISSHVQGSIRHLFDVLLYLKKIIKTVQIGRADFLEGFKERQIMLDRINNILERVGSDLDNVHHQTTTAIQNWGDIAPEALDYATREQELRLEKMNGERE
ncbi:hypothetical protein [Nocardiopsis ansamitocini]|uniref:Uncharacterized protein n=1 Tax=Nocardiopsis ansamitocini TaxID=1670832 RepID=A0A9W6PAU2_9ACTN|nr:hypothetical protein [Nocardiopsis ansamitocini]GLU50138.1 hypothetical protein Nans01_44890 [Nocardiopsis ansamitocini]